MQCVYAPNHTIPRREFIKNLPLCIGDSAGIMSVGCDFNTTMDLNEESSDRKGDNTKKSLQNFADSMRLTETSKYALDQEKRFSRKGPDCSETQIDSVLIEKSAENQVKYLDREYLTDGNRRLSDHAWLML